MKKIIYLVVLAAVGVGIYYFVSGAGPLTVPLLAIDNSGISGTAVLSEVDGQLQVKISMVGDVAGTSMPAHIHEGVCPGIGAIAYSLETVVDGNSVTTYGTVKLADIRAREPLAINVHKSANEIGTYVACGNIGR